MSNPFSSISVAEVTEDSKPSVSLGLGIHKDLTPSIKYKENGEKTQVVIRFERDTKDAIYFHEDTQTVSEKNAEFMLNNVIRTIFSGGILTVDKNVEFTNIFNSCKDSMTGNFDFPKFIDLIDQKIKDMKLAIKLSSFSSGGNYFSDTKIRFNKWGEIVVSPNPDLLKWNENKDNMPKPATVATNSFTSTTTTGGNNFAPTTPVFA